MISWTTLIFGYDQYGRRTHALHFLNKQDIRDLKFYVENVSLDKLVLEVDNLENFHFKETTIEFISKGTLNQLKFTRCRIGELTNDLKVVDSIGLTIYMASLLRSYL